MVQANVLTGTVNLSMRTMNASDTTALVVLGGYMLAFCGVAWRFCHRKLW
jgi:phosphatidylinositol glycan class W